MRSQKQSIYFTLLFLVAALGTISWAWASDVKPAKQLQPVHAGDWTDLAQIADLAKAKTDTINLYGGPGTLEGKFQDAAGNPDPQGWIPVDETAGDTVWNISDYQADNLDSDDDNLAWWCGEMFPACAGDDKEGGYGNDYNQELNWSAVVADPTKAATVTVTGILNLDTEPAYDYAHFNYNSIYGTTSAWIGDGELEGYEFSFEFTYQPGEYAGVAGDEVQLGFLVNTDGVWSDEDCLYATVGAIQVDNIQVTIDQDGTPPVVSPVETCQPGDPVQWEATGQPGCGNFGQLWTELDDLDPDQDNHSPQWAFIDDGLVVPGTGGSLCDTWCYGPDGFVINGTGGLCGEGSELINSVLSPPIELPRSPFKSLVVSFDTYLHAYIYPGYVGFMQWHLETTADPTGLSGWEVWQYNNAYFHPDGEYSRFETAVGKNDLAEDACLARIRLVLWVNNIFTGGTEADMTPAPYFDNVRLQAVKTTGKPPEDDIDISLRVDAAPNPFNPSVTISYAMPKDGQIAVRIYDIQGRLVNTLIDGTVAAGPGQVTWRGTDQAGRSMATGVYFVLVVTPDETVSRKLLLAK